MPKMCIPIPWTMLCFYLGIEHFSFHIPILPLLCRHMQCISASCSYVGSHCIPHPQSPPALLWDMISPSSLLCSLHVLCLTKRECGKWPLPHPSVCFCPSPCAPAFLLTLLKAEVPGAPGQGDHVVRSPCAAENRLSMPYESNREIVL